VNRRKVWRWILGVTTGLLLVLGGVFWNLHRQATLAFERHDRLVKEAIASIRARPVGRPCLFEPPLEGNGWDDYVKALAAAKAIPESEADDLPRMSADDVGVDPDRVREILDKHAVILELLRRSGRHAGFAPGYRYEDALRMDMSALTSAVRTVRFLSGWALHSHGQIEDGPALEAVVLALAVGHDAGRAGPVLNLLYHHACEAVGTEVARDILEGHALDAADLRRFADRLDRLWAARPTIGDGFRIEDAIHRRALVDAGLGGPDLDFRSKFPLEWETYRTWRYLYSRRLAYAGALGELEQRFRELSSLESLAPELRPPAADRIRLEARSSKNPVVNRMIPDLTSIYLHESLAMMNWTLMRVATAIAWYESEKGVPPEKLDELVPRYLPNVPSCPLTGKPLGYEHGRVWSVGLNGVDDGGLPGMLNGPLAVDGDVVWAVRRE